MSPPRGDQLPAIAAAPLLKAAPMRVRRRCAHCRGRGEVLIGLLGRRLEPVCSVHFVEAVVTATRMVQGLGTVQVEV